MADIRMPEARYVRNDGENREETVVYLPGETPSVPGAVAYNADDDKRRLKDDFTLSCRFCTAKVHFNKGARRIAGDNLDGPSAHFHTNPGQTHGPECRWPAMTHEQNQSVYDEDRGYKIHLTVDGLSSLFKKKGSRVYKRGEDKKIITLAPDLTGRRPKSIRGVDDLVALLDPADEARIKDSVVVHHNHIVPWPAFFVRYGAGERFKGLVSRLHDGGALPCLMEFRVKADRGLRPGSSRRANCVPSQPVGLGVYGGRSHVIQPQAWLDSPLVAHRMATPGRYLVMGYARLKPVANDNSVTHYLNISVTRPQQVARFDMALIAPKSP